MQEPEQTAKTLADRLLVNYIDLDTLSDDQINLSLLPDKFIQEHQILPLEISNNILQIVIADPPKHRILNEITFRTGNPVAIHIASKNKLSQRISRLLHLQEQEILTKTADTSDISIVHYVEKLLQDAVNKRVSDIHIETHANFLQLRWRIDGILYPLVQFPLSFAQRLISHLKILAQCDIAERRLPQDGRFQVKLSETMQNSSIDCRINTCPTLHGEKIVIRLLNAAHVDLIIDQLGFSAPQKNKFIKTLENPQGMILVTGPTGSGKTVTLYSALAFLNKSTVNISTVEDPIEIELPGINQVPVNSKTGLNFATVLRAFLRQDPDIIMVGEMRDTETAEIALKAAQTGHLVLSTLHTNNAPETITRLINMNIAPYNIAASVSLIIAQRLVRVLCPHCKLPEAIQPQEINFTTYRAIGCSKCQAGYLGRTSIYELLPMTESIAKIIIHTRDSLKLFQQAREEGMQTLYENGLEKVRAGITSLTELTRVIQQ